MNHLGCGEQGAGAFPGTAHPGGCTGHPQTRAIFTAACTVQAAKAREPTHTVAAARVTPKNFVTGRTCHSESLKDVNSPSNRSEQASGHLFRGVVCVLTVGADFGSPHQMRTRVAPDQLTVPQWPKSGCQQLALPATGPRAPAQREGRWWQLARPGPSPVPTWLSAADVRGAGSSLPAGAWVCSDALASSGPHIPTSSPQLTLGSPGQNQAWKAF